MRFDILVFVILSANLIVGDGDNINNKCANYKKLVSINCSSSNIERWLLKVVYNIGWTFVQKTWIFITPG